MLLALVIALIIAVAVGLLCIGLGRAIKTIPAPITVAIGGFLEEFGWAIGLLAGLWYFFAGGHLKL